MCRILLIFAFGWLGVLGSVTQSPSISPTASPFSSPPTRSPILVNVPMETISVTDEQICTIDPYGFRAHCTNTTNSFFQLPGGPWEKVYISLNRVYLLNPAGDLYVWKNEVLQYVTGNVISFSASRWSDAACLVYADGSLYCRGNSISWQFPAAEGMDGNDDDFASMNYDSILRVTVGFNHTCVLSQERNVLCTGDNTLRQAGDQYVTARSDLNITLVDGSIREIQAGYDHTCAMGDQIFCWGRNHEWQTGVAFNIEDTGIKSTIPSTAVPYDYDGPPQGIRLGITSTCVWYKGYPGQFFCGGRNFYGQYGDGTKLNAGQTWHGRVSFGGGDFLDVGNGNKTICAWSNHPNPQFSCAGEGFMFPDWNSNKLPIATVYDGFTSTTPTISPTYGPTISPITSAPTWSPTTSMPSVTPTMNPTSSPTVPLPVISPELVGFLIALGAAIIVILGLIVAAMV